MCGIRKVISVYKKQKLRGLTAIDEWQIRPQLERFPHALENRLMLALVLFHQSMFEQIRTNAHQWLGSHSFSKKGG